MSEPRKYSIEELEELVQEYENSQPAAMDLQWAFTEICGIRNLLKFIKDSEGARTND